MRDPNLVRKEMLALDEVLPFVVMPSKAPEPVIDSIEQKDDAPKLSQVKEALVDIKGDQINMGTLKLQNFVENGTKCIRCKCEAEYFAKEKYPTIPFYHLNLYAMKKGRETPMLKELVMPIEKGGEDTVSNSQTICFDCHKKKVNPPADLDARRRKRAIKRSENKKKKAAGEVKVKVGEKKPRKY